MVKGGRGRGRAGREFEPLHRLSSARARDKRVAVQVLDESGGDSLVRDPQGRELHDGTQVAIACVDGRALDTLGEGDAVDAELAVTTSPSPTAPVGKP